jgi:hypothetical protein
MPAAAPILQAAFHFHGAMGGGDGFTAVSFAELPLLHTLSLTSVKLSTAQLVSLVQSCPAVEHVVLCDLYNFTLDLLPVFGRSSRRLRQLEIDECPLHLFSRSVEEQLTPAEQAGSNTDAVFPQLVALTIWIGPIGGGD